MQEIQEIVDSFFMNSHDFNGILLAELLDQSGLEKENFLKAIEEGINGDSLSIQWGENPHIIRLAHSPREKQLELIRQGSLFGACAYPTETRMNSIRNTTNLDDRPYLKRLAYAEPQLKPVFFEMDVLERYAFDPRYIFEIEGYEGHIFLHDEFFEGKSLPEHDKVLIDTFGIGHRKRDGKRVVCVYLRYLKDLSAEHQNYWRLKEIDEECNPFYFYYANTALGSWEFGETLFTAFIKAQKEINDLTELIYGEKLFRKSFEHEQPKEFSYILSPTQKNYFDFMLLLDKMISENINKYFFEGKVELETEEAIGKNKVKVVPKNTISLLSEWIYSLIGESNDKRFDEIVIKPLKKIRRVRQDPAH